MNHTKYIAISLRQFLPIFGLLLFSFSGNAQKESCKDDILNKVNAMIGTGANGAVIPVAVANKVLFSLAMGPDRNGEIRPIDVQRLKENFRW